VVTNDSSLTGREGNEGGGIGGRRMSAESLPPFRQGKAGAEESRASSAEAPPLPMKERTPYAAERITLPPGSGAGGSSQARGSGRFAWHHEALVFSRIGREKAPASFCGDPPGTLGKGFFPADAARAHRPEPRATDRDSLIVKGGEE